VDFSKITERLPDFTPRWTVQLGVEELYRAYTAAELTAEEWEGWRYYRLKTVRRLQDAGVLDAELRFVTS
jgi:hypothetical protein